MCSGPKENVLKILLVIEAVDDDDRILRNGNAVEQTAYEIRKTRT